MDTGNGGPKREPNGAFKETLLSSSSRHMRNPSWQRSGGAETLGNSFRTNPLLFTQTMELVYISIFALSLPLYMNSTNFVIWLISCLIHVNKEDFQHKPCAVIIVSTEVWLTRSLSQAPTLYWCAAPNKIQKWMGPKTRFFPGVEERGRAMGQSLHPDNCTAVTHLYK